MTLLRHDPLSLDEAIAAVRAAGAGAIATFVGVVRDHNLGKPVTLLEYEVYDKMAEAELAHLLEEISRTLPGTRLFAAHRVGRLGIGEAAVVCAASAAHRDEAFRACRLLIDGIKARLPIWKREHGPDGPYWVGWEDARCGTEGTALGAGHSHG
jgi:molybdopterin synthase catalytic subunit